MSKVVSIITPSFNRGYIIDETAQSIFRQTSPDWEWVIVDDGSTDDSWQKLSAYAQQDSRVKIYKRDREPKGACTCRNIAVERCTGDYVMFLDTDDVLADYCIEHRLNAIERKDDIDFMIFPMMLFRNQPDDMGVLWNVDKDQDDLLRILMGDPICQGTGTLWKKSSFVEVGMWKEDLRLWQDVELHIRSLLWPMKYAKNMGTMPDVYLRTSDDSLSRVGYYTEPKMKSRIAVFEYACNQIGGQEKLNTYIDGLRIMGLDVICGAIVSKYKAGVQEVLRTLRQHNIFSNSEINTIIGYQYATQYKLYKIPFLYNRIKQRTLSIISPTNNTVGIVKWNKINFR